jgi:hypothetical protein
MLQTGWYGEVHVKSEDSHRHRALLGARDQLVTNKRMLCGQIRGLLRPFGITVKVRMGSKRFDETARACCAHDDLLYVCISALLEALGAIESQIAALDKKVREIVSTSMPCWHRMSVPGVGPVTALSFMATIENPQRFMRSRDIGAYLGLTPRRYQSGERDVSGGSSRQGDAMTRHYLYGIHSARAAERLSGFVAIDGNGDEVAEAFDAELGEGHDAVFVVEAVDPDQAVLRLHFGRDICEPVLVFTEFLGDERDGPHGMDLVDVHRQAAIAASLERQFHGSSSSRRLTGCSAMRASTSASQACGSTSLSLAVPMRV